MTCDHGERGRGLSVISRGRNGTTASSPVDVDVLISLKLGIFLSGEDTERVGTEVVTLGLEDVGRNNLAPVTIQERKGR